MDDDSFEVDYRVYLMGILRRDSYALQGEDNIDLEVSFDKNIEDVDTDYSIVLKHLKEHGKSYVLEMKHESGASFRMKYEPVDDLYNEVESNPMQDAACTPEMEVTRAYKDIEKQDFPMSGPNIKKRGHTRQKLNHDSAWKLPDFRHEKESSMVDDNYMLFLSNIRLEGDTMILELGNDLSIEYEKVVESVTLSGGDEEAPALEASDAVKANSSRIFLYDDSLPFETNLMAFLSKPYDKREHEELMQEVSARKCVQEERRTRHRSVVYATTRQGKSYLEHFPDFAKELKVSAPHEALTLLRGFFFWLQHLSHDGAFKPWTASKDHFAIVNYDNDDIPPPLEIAMPYHM